jgi:hypothetical protein
MRQYEDTAFNDRAPKGGFAIVLYRNRVPVARCRAFFAEPGMLSVRAGPLSFPRYTRLEVEIAVEVADRRHRLPAVVAHSTREDLRLEMQDYTNQRFGHLHQGSTASADWAAGR